MSTYHNFCPARACAGMLETDSRGDNMEILRCIACGRRYEERMTSNGRAVYLDILPRVKAARVACLSCGTDIRAASLDGGAGSVTLPRVSCIVCARDWRVTVRTDDNGALSATITNAA